MTGEVEFEKAFAALARDRTTWNEQDVIRLARDLFRDQAHPEDGELAEVGSKAETVAVRCYLAAISFHRMTGVYAATVNSGQDPGRVMAGDEQTMELGTLRGRGGAKG